MANMQIISKTGEFVSNVEANNYVVREPGAIIKMAIDKKMIVGTQKTGEDLIILQKNGEKIVVQDFFKSNGKDITKLVIEDADGLFVSAYDVPFAGLSFTGVNSIDDVVANNTGDDAVPMWVFPLIAVTAIGGAIAASNSGGSSSSSKPSVPGKPGEGNEQLQKDLTGNTEVMKESLASLEMSIKTLSEEVAAVKANPTQGTVDTAADATAELEAMLGSAMARAEGIEAKIQAFAELIAQAKAAGLDVADAVKTLEGLKVALGEAHAEVGEAHAVIETAQALLDAAEAIVETAVAAEISTAIAKEAADSAKGKPAGENIEQAQADLGALNAAMGKLQSMVAKLAASIESAGKLGIAVPDALKTAYDEALGLLNAHEQNVADIEAALEQANANKALFDTASDAVEAASKSVVDADAALNAAKAQLAAALAAKADVLSKNDTARVDEVNQMIKEANAAVAAAQAAKAEAEAALKVAADALGLVDEAGIDAEFSNGIKEQLEAANNALNELPELELIDSELGVEGTKTFWESISDFVQNGINYFKDMISNIIESKPGQIVSGIISGISTVAHVVLDMIKSPLNAIKVIIGKVKEAGGDVVSWLKETVGIFFSAVGEGAKAIYHDVMETIKAIPKAIVDNIGAIIKNPLDGIYQVIKGVIGEILMGVAKVFSDVTTIVVDMITDKLIALGELGTNLINDFTSAVKDVIKVFYDAFIKNPLDQIIKPIFDFIKQGIGDFFESPIKFIMNIISEIKGTISDVIKIVVDLFKVPGDTIAAIGKLITDIIDGIKGSDKVIEKEIAANEQPDEQANAEGEAQDHDVNAAEDGSNAGQEPSEMPEGVPALAKLLDLITANADIKTADKVADDLAGMKLIAANGEGDINLDNVVSEESAGMIEQLTVEAVQELAIVNPIVLHEDEMSTLVTLAA